MANVTDQDLARAERDAATREAAAEAARILENPLVVQVLSGMERDLLASLRQTSLANHDALVAATAGLQAVHVFRGTFEGLVRKAAYARG